MTVLPLVTANAMAANPVVSADSHALLANTPNQVIQLSIAGTDNVAGEDLYFQINDGVTGPAITSVDILSDTIFATNNTGENGGHAPTGVVLTTPYANHLAILSTTTNTGTVVDNGLLARITLDTTGFAGSTFALTLFGTVNGNSDLLTFSGTNVVPVYPSFPANQFTVSAPEPATLSLFALASLALVRRPGNRHRNAEK